MKAGFIRSAKAGGEFIHKGEVQDGIILNSKQMSGEAMNEQIIDAVAEEDGT